MRRRAGRPGLGWPLGWPLGWTPTWALGWPLGWPLGWALGWAPTWALAATWALYGAPGALAPARAQDARTVYLGELSKDDPPLARALQELDAALARDPAPAAPALARLLRATLDPRRQSALTDLAEAGPQTQRAFGLREALARRLAALPPAARAALAAPQEEAARLALASQSPPDADELLTRFPLSGAAARAGLRLWSRAVEAGDRPAQAELRRWLGAAHPELTLPAPPPAPAPAAAQAPAAAARLELVASHPLLPGGRLEGGYSPCAPLAVGEQVVVGDGGRLHVFHADGRPLGAAPVTGAAASDGPEPSGGFEARGVAWGGVVFAPLLLNGPLAPGRSSLGRDESFGGRYYSLVALDPARARVLWWDGDPGPRGAGPPGLGADPELSRWLRRAHVLALAAGPRRVYAAFSVPGRDSALWLMAYERVSGEQPLALRPAWAAPTYLLTSERRQGDSSAPIIAPELSVALTLDPDGDLLVTTDLGVAAAVAPRSGALRWLARCQPGNFQQGLPAEPPLRAGGAVHYLIGGRLYQLDPETGDARWSQPVGAASRLLAGEGFLLAYGEQRAFGLDLERGQTLFGLQLQSRDRYRCVGRIVRCGERLLVPLWRRGPGGRVAVLRRDAASQAWIAAEEVALPKIEGPFNLALTPRGVVGAAARRAVFLAWREPGRDF